LLSLPGQNVSHDLSRIFALQSLVRPAYQTDRQIALYFSNNTQYTIELFCSETGLR
jgi:hypothetical protein